MRTSARLGFGLLFLLSGATGLVYELLWVRVLYQTFGSTIQSGATRKVVLSSSEMGSQ